MKKLLLTLVLSSLSVAANYVFTKNGLGAMQPWVVMSQTDMQRLYPEANAQRTVVVRRNGSRSLESLHASMAAKSGR